VKNGLAGLAVRHTVFIVQSGSSNTRARIKSCRPISRTKAFATGLTHEAAAQLF
jgi:hypothetical protein